MKIYKCKLCKEIFSQEQGDCYNGQFSCPNCETTEPTFLDIIGDYDYDEILGWNIK